MVLTGQLNIYLIVQIRDITDSSHGKFFREKQTGRFQLIDDSLNINHYYFVFDLVVIPIVNS